MLQTSKASHIKSQAHQTALGEQNSNLPGAGASTAAPDIRAAHLSFIDSLAELPQAQRKPEQRPQSPDQDPFSDVMQYEDGFFDASGTQIIFSAGSDLGQKNKLTMRKFTNRWIDLFLFPTTRYSARIRDESDDEDEQDDFGFAHAEEDEAWFPHGSRTMFMLDLLDNLPRLRLSDDHLKSIIWVMRECKTPNVPSFSALRKKQAGMTRDTDIKTQHHTSSLGNHFYMNHPGKLLALVSGPISEFWQAGKWTSEVHLDELSPMWANWDTAAHRHFYVNELARQRDGTYVVPVRWVTVNDVVHADVHEVEFIAHEAGDATFEIKTGSFYRIPAATLEWNYLDLKVSFSIKFTEYSTKYEMPHPLREKARGRPLFRLRTMPWSDDVSGNVSKQYNAHTNTYVTNLNLPHGKLSQEYFVRFTSTSPHASSSEQFVALGEDFVPGNWHEAYDCQLEQEILFEIIPHVLPADNPQQSETSSHIGMGGNLGCRRDLTGGTKEQQETDEGYHATYEPGQPRDKEGTIQVIRWQFWAACLGNQKNLDASYSQTGVKDKISQFWIQKLLDLGKERRLIELSDRRTRDPRLNSTALKGEARTAVKDEILRRIQQELWDWVIQQPAESFALLDEYDRVDPHRDTPGEILHTYLLGNDRYIWHDTTKQWDDKKEDIFAARLSASSIDGLSIPPPRPRYVVQYKNSLIGKHFKMLQQLGVFHVHDLCSPLLFDLWKATGELGALLWFPEIKDMKQYLADLKILIANVLDIWGLIDPQRILVKGKLHVLPHLIEDILRFGPAILYATEIFECWNAIFRLCSVFSNHLAPSRDIAMTLADMERFKHVVSGGWWKNSEGIYIRAGSLVRSFLTSNKQLQRRLGWAEKSHLEIGSVKLQSNAKRDSQRWNTMVEGFDLTEPTPGDSSWVLCKYAVAQSGDMSKERSWIFFRMAESPSTFAGRISKIIAREQDSTALSQQRNAVLIVEPFIVSDVKDPRLNMPLLHPSPEAQAMLIKPKDILFVFNVQHDCVTCGCSTISVALLQERIVTERTELQTKHSSEQRFVLNMHGLHNAHLIRDILPRSLTEPMPYLSDRVASHSRFAALLRQTGPAKRAETKARTQATRARNKQTKAAMVSAQTKRQEAERNNSGSDDEEDQRDDEEDQRDELMDMD
ncbi:hypothetical protein DFH09DRAFT_1257967 [Mycena vulgaris]|nr:hypothetical protein DFH09DRAFT_1257967 [Mycena vulgaris]